MHKVLKVSSLLIVLVATLFGLAELYHAMTDGFMVWKITCQPTYDPKWDVGPPQMDLNPILSQKFHYIGKGGQSFAFMSDDGKYVIKFLKQYRLWPRDWWNSLPCPSFLDSYREKKISSVRKRRENLFLSYKIAYEKLGKETGLLAIQLNPRYERGRRVTLVDSMGVSHRVDLSKTVFALQQRAETVNERLHRLMDAGDVESAKLALDALIVLLDRRCKMGIRDEEFHRNFGINYGFLDNRAIGIDLGRYRIREDLKDLENSKKEILYITDRFREWLERDYPLLNEYFIQKLVE